MKKIYAISFLAVSGVFLAACGDSTESATSAEPEENAASAQQPTQSTIGEFDVVPAAEQTQAGTSLSFGETAFVPFSAEDPSTMAVTVESIAATTEEELLEEGATKNDIDDYYTIRYSIQNVSETDLPSTFGGYRVSAASENGAVKSRSVIGSNPGSLDEDTTPLCGSSGFSHAKSGASISYCDIQSIPKGTSVKVFYGDFVSWEG